MDRRLSIVYVTTSLESGGAEMMLYHLASHLNPQQFRVNVLSLMTPGPLVAKFQAAGIPVHSIEMPRGGIPTLPMLWRLIQLLRQLQPDLLQGWMYHGNLAAQIASFCLLQRSLPVLWSIHYTLGNLATDRPMTKALIKAGSLLSRFPARMLFVSQLSQQQHIELGYRADNCSIIPNGFDLNSFVPTPSARSIVRDELGLVADTPIVGSFARYSPMKDHANFLRAAAILHQQCPNVHFLLAGTQIDRQNQPLNALITELKLTECVHLLGERRDVSTLMAGLDLVTTSSAYGEAFPMIVGEAMACGIPCVVTDVGESGWMVGDTGRVVPPQDAPALASGWQDLLELGSEGRASLGVTARQRIVDNFSLDAIVTQYESLYKYLLP